MTTAVFVFPETVSTRADVFKVIEDSLLLKDAIVERAKAHIRELWGEGADDEGLERLDDYLDRFDKAMQELGSNLLIHDALGYHGEDWSALECSVEASIPAEKIADARGRKCSLELRISSSEIVAVAFLARPFEAFAAKWARATNYQPTIEELLTNSGRGFVFIANVFETGEYDNEARTLTFTHRRRAAD